MPRPPDPRLFFMRVMCWKRFLLMIGWLAVAGSLPARAQDVVFQDSFQGQLGDGWSWVREDPPAWRVTRQGLEIRLQPGNMWGGANNAKNVLVRSVPAPTNGPVEVSVTITNQPSEQYEQVDLVWYYDDSHMVKIGQEQVDGKLCLVMGREEKDRTRTIAIIPIDFHLLDLRFQASGNEIRGQVRRHGADSWRDAGACSLPIHGDPKVSLQVYQGPRSVERWARFNDFRVVRTNRGGP